MYSLVTEAATALNGIAHRTPVITSRTLDGLTGNKVFLKCENFQRMGAFKFRGAYNAISKLSEREKAKGVITYSSGNHAQAVALVCQMLGIKAIIVMPHDAPIVKIEATKGYGAELVTYQRGNDDREQVAAALCESNGYTLIPPFNHYDIIAGQGTVAKELLEEVGELDYIFAPCGGGGLLSGSAIAAKGLFPSCKVIGVEPEGADDAVRSYRNGEIVRIEQPKTVADGVRTNALGSINFSIIKELVDDMVSISDEDIIKTMHFMWSRMKIVVEPTGAVSLAPILNNRLELRDKKIGVIISGGNVDIEEASSLFSTVLI